MKNNITNFLARAVIILINSLLIWWFWNEVAPQIFGLIEITYFQAVYLYLLVDVFRSSSKLVEYKDEDKD